MNQIVDNLRRLGPAKLAALGGALLITVGLMGALALQASRPSLALLYAGLDPAVAGEVVRKLEGMEVQHAVEGDAILVDQAERDRVRMALAEEGLPRRGQAGYELLDQLSGFGTTTDMFDAAYWRAKEGELARTIDTLANVAESRVHIVPPSRSVFGRGGEPSASVAVTTRDGAALTRSQATAIRHLIGLAVRGLSPDRVSVIDTEGGLVLASGSPAAGANDDARSQREQALRAELESLIGAHVGSGLVRVRVALELDTTAESVTERTLDPESRVAVHTDTSEIEDSSRDAEGEDAVGVAGNLPNEAGDGAAGPTSQSSRTESRELANYEVSEVRRERRTEAGGVKRLSVAVLVGGVQEVAGDGAASWRPQDEAELEAIRTLVRAAVGFDAARGDEVVVQSLPFQSPAGTPATEAPFDLATSLLRHAGVVAPSAGLLIAVLALILFVLRPLARARTAPAAQPPSLPAAEVPAPALEAGTVPATVQAEPARPAEAAPATPLRRAIAASQERPDEALRVLAGWLDDARTPEVA
ncbi:flagellar basal-body MS-ring/collar protein FliF [Marinivivus vitaminiproducens]|uniref:flagellar basal-body MS-ring/collar protein FliF n=1 Tax=Marinivivus vitaminiproducens TaxID=3035935 RepID=UPI0027A5FB9C|nr:flagellar basal-body MS-ring/collar protein FliF [Geminicoccaceae bacterium SCSIO 64248]